MSNEIKGTVATVGNISGTLNAGSGFDGASAYEVAVKNGFEGTEAEWLESLQGESGVYVGSGDMPENCNVQIDPEGEVLSIEHTYSPTSENPQSGIAVADAISTLQTNNGTVVSPNADFAEVAEWADGNPNNEDRTGYFVCANVPIDGIVMKKATSIDDVKGVSILAPAFAGNYSKDKVDANGNLLPKYSYVAIIGFVPVRDNGTCEIGGRCMPDDNGCAIPSINSMGYQVVNRIDENRVLIIIEPNGDMVQRVKTKITAINEELSHKANNIVNSASGSSILLTDSSNYPLENLKVYGKSTQDGTPTPEAPIDIVSAGASGSVEVKVCGANLFNANSPQTPPDSISKCEIKENGRVIEGVFGKAPWSRITFQSFRLLKGVTYTISIDNLISTGQSSVQLNINSTQVAQLNNNKKSHSFTPKSEIPMATIMFIGNSTASSAQENISATVEGLRITTNASLPYEPYTEQPLTLATPNELKSVGSYADYIDLEKGVRVQNIEITRLTSDKVRGEGGNDNFDVYEVEMPTPYDNALTPYFQRIPRSETVTRVGQCKCVETNQRFYPVFAEKGKSTIESFKQWIDSIGGLPFYYVLNTPIETPLTAEEIAYYKALHTNYPNTTIFNTDGTNMDVSYVADTKLYIDNKFAELQALALEG